MALFRPPKGALTRQATNLRHVLYWCRTKVFQRTSPQTSLHGTFRSPIKGIYARRGNGRTEVGYSQTEAGISARRRERLDRNGTAGQGVCAWGCAQALVYTIWVLWEAFAQRRKRPAACHQATDALAYGTQAHAAWLGRSCDHPAQIPDCLCVSRAESRRYGPCGCKLRLRGNPCISGRRRARLQRPQLFSALAADFPSRPGAFRPSRHGGKHIPFYGLCASPQAPSWRR